MKQVTQLWIVAVLLLLLLALASTSSAQPPPDSVINPILADLSQRVGRTVTLADLVTYSWTTRTFNNDSLDCPSPDQTYTRSFVAGYIVRINYGNLFWDYRYDAGRNTFFLCNSPNLDNLILPVTATPTVPPTSTPLPVTATAQPTNTLPPTATVPPANTTTTDSSTGNQAQPVARVSATPNPATLLEGERPCPEAITGQVPTRLTVGSVGQFVGSPQNIHESPNRTAPVLATTTVGNTFSVLDGPECDRAFTWWQVDTAGLVGWVGEVNPADLSYWLQPSDPATVSSSDTTANQAAGNPSPTPQPQAASALPQLPEAANQALASPRLILTAATSTNPEGIAVIAGEAGLLVYSLDDLTAPLFTLSDQAVLEMALSPDGNGIIALQNDPIGAAQLAFYTTTGQNIGNAPLSAAYVQGMAFLPALNLLALGGDENVMLYDLASNQVVAELALNTAPLALASHSATSRLAILLEEQILVMDINTRSELGRITLPTSQNGAVGLAFSPDGASLAVSNGAQGGAIVINLSDFQTRATVALYPANSGEVVAIAFSPDGSRLALAGWIPSGVTTSEGAQLALADATTGRLISQMAGIAGDQTLLSLAFHPDGSLLTAVSAEGLWQAWAVE